MGPKPRSVNEYLARLEDDQRAALEKLRRQILAAAPGAVECIAYNVPSYRVEGKLVMSFGAAKTHCSLYPGRVIVDFTEELKDFDTESRGTIRFQPNRPLPAKLVRALVKARIARDVP